MARRIKFIKTVTVNNFTYQNGKYYEVLKSFGKKMMQNGDAVAVEDLPVLQLEDIKTQELAALKDLENEYALNEDESRKVTEELPKGWQQTEIEETKKSKRRTKR